MKHLPLLLLTLLTGPAAAMVQAGGAAAQPPANRPNVLIILADDLGYGDVQCNNRERSKIPTPHIDRLAAQGMRFTDGHSSAAACSPSRYTLLTGRYHWRTRLQAGIVGVWERPLIAPERLTIASLAKQHGYRTAAVGKWHLGWDWPFTPEQRPLLANFGPQFAGLTDAHRAAWNEVFSRPIPGGPTSRGFDYYFGTDVPNWPPYCFIENDRTIGIPSELLPPGLLRNHQASIQGPALPKWSFEAILGELGNRASAFITRAAAAPEPFLLYLPLTSPHTPLAPSAEWKGKSGLDHPAADLIMETDAVVGRLLAALEKTGEANNTLVLFTSDNGFAHYVGVKELEQRGHFPSGPLRGYKRDVYEGGHREPFIVRWPAVVKPGTVNGQLVHQADLMATLSEIWGVQLPEGAGEDSFSFLPLLRGEDRPVRAHAVSCASNGIPGLRQGPWKLVLVPDAKVGTEVQLYHLGEDLAETSNVAAAQPERVTQMRALMETLIVQGRSTPGARQKNDVRVRRYPAMGARPPQGRR